MKKFANSVIAGLAFLAACGSPAAPAPKKTNHPPVVGEASLGTGPFLKTSTLTVTAADVSDADGNEVTLAYAWQINGQPAAGQTGTALSGVFRKGDEVSCVVTPNDGKIDGPPRTSNRVVIQNSAPTLAGAALGAGPFTKGSTLTVTPGATGDVDGDTVTLTYEWFVNGSPVAGQAGPALSGASFSKGDRVFVRVTPNDGSTDGAPFDRNTVIIQDSAPVLSSAAIAAGNYTQLSTLQATAGSATDRDGDSVTFTYQWLADGAPIAGAVGPSLTGASFSKGQSVSVVITPGDGAVHGLPVTSTAVTIGNSLPVLAGVSIGSGPFTRASTLTATPGLLTDPDPADTPVISYQWFRNGSAVAGQAAPAYTGTQNRGDVIFVRATPSDGAAGTPVDSSAITIQNSLPVLTAAAIPAGTYSQADTVPVVSATATDADGDTVTLHYHWFVNGVAFNGPIGAHISTPYIRHGDIVFCRVSPYDGTGEGSFVETNAITLQNTAPVLSGASLGTGPFFVNSTLSAAAGSTFDADGDSVALSFRWTKNNVVIPLATTGTLSGVFAKGDQIRVEITPNDGVQNGLVAVSNTLTIQNSPPAAPAPDLGAGPFFKTSTLTATLGTPQDLDGDALTLANAWYRNGILVGGATGLTLTGASFARGDFLQFKWSVDDGTTRVTEASSTVTINNSLPTASGVSISGSHFTDSTLTAIAAGLSDADADAVTVAYQWFRNGVSMPGQTAVTLAGPFSPGDAITVRATPSDGTANGTPVNSGAVTILGNLISSLSPASGIPGQTIAILGSGLGATQGTNTVTVGGQIATVVDWSPTLIHIVVPSLPAGNHPVAVVLAGVTSNALSFGFAVQLSGFTPASGSGGTELVLSGTGFGAIQSGTVTVGGVAAAITSWSATEIRATVPDSAPACLQQVILAVGAQASTPQSFTVVPVITGLDQATVSGGDALTVTGTNLGATQGSSVVTLGNALATIQSWTATSITVTVPPTSSAGTLDVVVHLGSGITTVTLASTDVPKAIPDGGATASALDASSVSGSLLNLDVQVNLTHPWIGDLSVALRGPDGTSALLYDRQGAFGQNLVTSYPTPSAPVQPLSPFRMKNPSGTWSLEATDHEMGDTGTISGWGLALTVSKLSTNPSPVTVRPRILSLSLGEGSGQTAVTLFGTNFGDIQGGSTLELGGISIPVSHWAPDEIQVVIPNTVTAGTQPFVVRTGGLASAAVNFRVIPKLLGLSPTGGTGGNTVTITGTNLGSSQGTSAISPFGKAGGSVVSWNQTAIVATIPGVVEAGVHEVGVSVGGIPSNALALTVMPRIQSLSRYSGSGGDTITVSGTNFGATRGSGSISLGGIVLPVLTWSNTSISIALGNTLEPGTQPVFVSAGGLSSNVFPFSVTPHIDSISQASGFVDTPFTVYGRNFGSSQGTRHLLAGSAPAVVQAWFPDRITAAVPVIGVGAANVKITSTIHHTYSLSAGTAINANETWSAINVTEAASVVEVNVSIAISSPNPGSLAVFLQGSYGQSTLTWGGTAANLNTTYDTLTTPATSMALFNGHPAQGTWQLIVENSSGGYGGNLDSWSLELSMAGGVSSNPATFTVLPHLLSFEPDVANEGQYVTAHGTNMSGYSGNHVYFESIEAIPAGSMQYDFTQFQIPAGLPYGPHAVTVSVDGYVSNPVTFTVRQALSTLSLTSGAPGTALAIYGTGFLGAQGASTVTVGGMAAAVTSWTDTEIDILVPPLLGFGIHDVQVFVQSVGSNVLPFQVRAQIDSLSPASGYIGDEVTLSGAVFGATQGTSTVSLGGSPAQIVSWSDTSITITIPLNTPAGNLPVVVTAGGVPSNTVMLTVKPRVVSVTPAGATGGDIITIAGNNFGFSQGYGQLIIGGLPAAVVSWTETAIQAVVPNTVGAGNVVVELRADTGSETKTYFKDHTGGPLLFCWEPLYGCFESPSDALTVDDSRMVADINIDLNVSDPMASGFFSRGAALIKLRSPGNALAVLHNSLSPDPSGQAINANYNLTATAIDPLDVFMGTGALGDWLLECSMAHGVGQVDSWGLNLTFATLIYSNPVTTTIRPTITSLTPGNGPAGSGITLTGTNFGNVPGSVGMGGVTAPVGSWSMLSISATVPGSLAAGQYGTAVTVNGLTSAPFPFLIDFGISSLSPASGGRGTSVTIAGSGFGNSQVGSTIDFGGTSAGVVSWSENSIVVTVPLALAFGTYAVSVQVGGNQSNELFYTVTARVDSVTPDSGSGGTVVTLSGGDFGASQGASTLTLGGVAISPSAWYDSAITITVTNLVPAGVQPLVLSVQGYETARNFRVTPGLTGITPGSGIAGTMISISGHNFGASTGAIRLQGTWGTVDLTNTITAWSETLVQFTVPYDVSGGIKALQVIAGETTGALPFTVIPSLHGFETEQGSEGQIVNLMAANHGSGDVPMTVYFGRVATEATASVTDPAAPGRVRFSVPPGFDPGAQDVTLAVGGVASDTASFTVVPFISALSVTHATGNDLVSIQGVNFGPVEMQSIWVGEHEIRAASWSRSAIEITVPATLSPTAYDTAIRDGTGNATFAAAVSAAIPSGGSIEVSTATNWGGILYSLSVTVDISHPNVGCLMINLRRNANMINLLNFWQAAGTELHQSFTVPDFNGVPAAATWTLVVIDGCSQAGGMVQAWGMTAASNPRWQSNPVPLQIMPTLFGLSKLETSYPDFITVSGTNFGIPQGSGLLTLGSEAPAISEWSSGAVTFQVPETIRAGIYTVALRGGGQEHVRHFIPAQVRYGGFQFRINRPSGTIVDGTVSQCYHIGYYPSVSIWSEFASQYLSTCGTETLGSFIGQSPVSNWGYDYNSGFGPVGDTGDFNLDLLVNTDGALAPVTSLTVRPKITSLNFASGIAGTLIIVNGHHFGYPEGTIALMLGGVAPQLVDWSPNTIWFTVPNSTMGGSQPITVAVDGVSSLPFAFRVVPYLTSVSPTSGPAGTELTLSGTSFGDTQGASQVTIGGLPATVNTWAQSSIQAVIPGGLSGMKNVTVTIGGQTSNVKVFNVTP